MGNDREEMREMSDLVYGRKTHRDRDDRPTGWAEFGSVKFHFFGLDGRSLCSKWAHFTRNILMRDEELDDGEKCAACRRKRATMLRKTK